MRLKELNLSLLLLITEGFASWAGVAFLQDTLVFAIIYLLFKKGQAYYQKSHSSLKETIRVLSRYKAFGALYILAVLFFLLWISRWWVEFDQLLDAPVDMRYRTYLQAGTSLIIVKALLEKKWLRSWLLSIEMTAIRKVILFYLGFSVAGAGLLIMPWSLLPEASLSLIDSIFISISAISVTGLAPVDVASVLSMQGLTVLMVLVQIGGLGIVAITALLATLTQKRLSLENTSLGLELYDLSSMHKVSVFLQRVVLITLAFEAIGVFLIYFSLPSYTPDRLFHAVFHAVSAFCNAGFSSLPGNLENPITPLAKWPIAFLIIVGGIGFPVLMEAASAIKRKKPWSMLSSNFHMVVAGTTLLLVLGTLSLFSAAGFSLQAKSYSIADSFLNSLFYSISARTAGFNINSVADLGFASQFILIVLMFVGGGSISTAGGVKVTTIGVILASTLSILRGHKWAQFHKSEISPFVLQKAVAIVFLYIFTSFVALATLLLLESIDPWKLVFEVFSALSTVGLSLGATSELSPIGKVVVSLLMLIGRIGFITAVLVGVGRITSQRFRYSKGKFYVG